MSTTTMDAKTAILARARDAISRSQQGRPVRPIPRDYIRSTEHAPGSDAVVEEMIETLEDYSAQVVVVSSDDEAADAVSKFLADKEATSVVVPTGLDDVFKKAAARDGRKVREDSREQAIPTLELDEIDAVVTRSRVAISRASAPVAAASRTSFSRSVRGFGPSRTDSWASSGSMTRRPAWTLRIASASASGGVSLTMKPAAPASMPRER